jgi:hypothetical protein
MMMMRVVVDMRLSLRRVVQARSMPESAAIRRERSRGAEP